MGGLFVDCLDAAVNSLPDSISANIRSVLSELGNDVAPVQWRVVDLLPAEAIILRVHPIHPRLRRGESVRVRRASVPSESREWLTGFGRHSSLERVSGLRPRGLLG